MNFLYKFRCSLSTTSSLTMPKPALITKKSGSILFGTNQDTNTLDASDEEGTVDPIWMFGYKFHEREGGNDKDTGGIYLEQVCLSDSGGGGGGSSNGSSSSGHSSNNDDGNGADDGESDAKKDKKNFVERLAPLEAFPISAVKFFFFKIRSWP